MTRKQSKVSVSKTDRGKGKARRSNDSEKCVSCGVKYGAIGDPRLRETWFRCVTCGKWAHESCGNLDSVNFMCIGCMDSD